MTLEHANKKDIAHRTVVAAILIAVVKILILKSYFIEYSRTHAFSCMGVALKIGDGCAVLLRATSKRTNKIARIRNFLMDFVCQKIRRFVCQISNKLCQYGPSAWVDFLYGLEAKAKTSCVNCTFDWFKNSLER